MAHSPLRRPLHSRIIQFYNSRAPTYDTEDTFHAALAADFITWVSSVLPPDLTAPLKMLDLCCGTGLVSFAARERFGRDAVIYGVDISGESIGIPRAKAAALEMGEENGARAEGSMRFWEGSVVELDALAVGDGKGELQKGTYGLITCSSAFVLLPGDGTAVVRA
jgi:ubiquinone/menaquinone biosynthesis C-methylase UbiE